MALSLGNLGKVALPQLPKLNLYTGPERRKKPRVPLQELDEFSQERLAADFDDAVKEPDDRGTFTKVMDVLDVPRNAVANVIGDLTGVDKSKLQRGTFQKRVLMSDVLKKLGVKEGPAAAILGFVGDMAVDPLTYLSAGARTGLSIGRGAPKILKGGQSVLRRAAATGRVTDDLARALGISPKRFRKLHKYLTSGAFKKAHPKLAQSMELGDDASKWLMGKKGGELTKRLARRALPQAEEGIRTTEAGVKATQKWLARYGEPGRTIARIPGMEKGLSLPWGSRARMYKEFAEGAAKAPVKEVIEKAATASRAAQTMRHAGRALVEAEQRVGDQARRLQKLQDRFDLFLKGRNAAQKAGADLPDIARNVVPGMPSHRLAREFLEAQQQVRQLRGQLQQFRGNVSGPGGKLRKTLEQALSRQIDDAETMVRTLEQRVQEIVSGTPGPIAPGLKLTDAQRAALRAAIPQTDLPADVQQLRTPVQIARQGLAEAKATAPKDIARLTGQIGAQQTIREDARNVIRSLLSDPMSESESIRRLAAEQLGKAGLRHTQLPANAGLGTRVLHKARRFKQELFGPGAGELGQEVAGIRARAGTGSQAANAAMVRQAYTEFLPNVQKVAAKTGQSTQSVYDDIINFVEANLKAAPNDPLRAQLFFAADQMQDPNFRNALEWVQGQIRETGDILELRGVLDERLRSYFPRTVVPEFAKAGADEIAAQMGGKAWTSPRTMRLDYRLPDGSVKSVLSTDVKGIRDLAQAGAQRIGKYQISTAQWNKPEAPFRNLLRPEGYKGKQFSTDVPEALGSMAAQRERRLAYADMRDLAMRTGARIDEHVVRTDPRFRHMSFPQFDKSSPFYQLAGKQLEGMAFPQPVTDTLERFSRVFNTPKEIQTAVRATDFFFQRWKGVQLMHPAYTTRNVVQNFLGGLMAGAQPTRVARLSTPGGEMFKLVKALVNGDEIPQFAMQIGGRKLSSQTLADLLRKYNIINSSAMSQAMLPNWHQKVRMLGSKTLYRWFKFNNQIESTMKASTFVNFLEQGYDVRQALARTIRAMPDLTDLTHFEREVGRRVLPWMAWVRKNGALQLFHYLPNEPAWMAGGEKLRRTLEEAFTGGETIPEELRPEWMSEAQAAQVTGGADEGNVFLLASWLPFQELTKVLGSGYNLGEGMKNFLEQMRPEAKFFGEMALGRDLFRGRPVEKLSMADLVTKPVIPKALIGQSGTPLDNLLAIRPAREIARMPQWEDWPTRVQRALVGGAVQPISRERGESALAYKLRNRGRELRSALNRAVIVQDQPEQQALKEQILRNWAQMQRRGLEGVPKRIQRTLERSGVRSP